MTEVPSWFIRYAKRKLKRVSKITDEKVIEKILRDEIPKKMLNPNHIISYEKYGRMKVKGLL
jgi:hypothetical protein